MSTRLIYILAASLVALALLASPAGAQHRVHHGYPTWWVRQAACIRHYESHSEWHLNTGNGFYGAYQFEQTTWESRKAPSWPYRADLASPQQQTFAAWRNWVSNGRRWGGGQWPNSARACGVP